MKVLQSSVFRALCAIVTGILLVNNPDSTVRGITIAIGAMFLVSGVISCATYFSALNHAKNVEVYDDKGRLLSPVKPIFPIVGIGCVLLGVILMVMPSVFVTSLMYVLGAVLVLGAINQFVNLVTVKKIARIPFWFWVCPSLILLTGLWVIIKPMETASLPMLILGWCLMFYGVTECVNAFKIHREKKKYLMDHQ